MTDTIKVPRQLLEKYLNGNIDTDWVEAGYRLRLIIADAPAAKQAHNRLPAQQG